MSAKYIIGLSTGRTGTKYLAEVFSHCEQQTIKSVHESRYSRVFNILGTMYRSGLISEKIIRHTWKIFKGNSNFINQYDKYIDFNNHLYAIADIIALELKNVALIHIVRDPRTYIRSHINWSDHRLKSFIANRLTPFWQPNGAIIGQYQYAEWSQASRVEKYAWIWCYKNRLIESYKNIGVPYYLVRFEDLFSSKTLLRTNVEAISNFIGIDSPPNVEELYTAPINSSNKNSSISHQQWTDEEYMIINNICGDLMKKYNYIC